MSVTVEQLPDLNPEYHVKPETVAAYQRDGHAVVRKIATTEEMNPYYQYIAEAIDKKRRQMEELAKRDTYHKAFIQVGNLWTADEHVKKFVLARRFAKIAADLMGVDGVRLYHDQALFKEAGGGHTPWHQDQYYWPIDTRNTITMWMPFCEATIENGALTFASGIQNEGALSQMSISDKSAKWFSKHLRERDIPLRTYELDAGDATFHSGWTPHKAPGNSTDKMRPVMTIIYMAADARVSEPANEHQPVDMKVFFPGLKPGDLAATHLNPVVWHKDATKISNG